MSDFLAGYVSGAIGVIVGSPLDIVKVRHQAPALEGLPGYYSFESVGSLVRGAAAPILGYGALNALLFVSYNRTLEILGESPASPSDLWKIWFAGATGGLMSFIISAPTELVKCRAQLSSTGQSSWSITKEIYKLHGLRGLYHGGMITSLRDSIGYGFYFWAYEGSRKLIDTGDDAPSAVATKVLLCGGIAGCATWLSVYPLDVIKTRVQAQVARPLLAGCKDQRLTTLECTKKAIREGGLGIFFSGLGVCMARAFLVNAVQWAVYEWVTHRLRCPADP